MATRERPTKKQRKRFRRAVRAMIRLLRHMSLGQGHVGVWVFDCGAGGGFSSGGMEIIWERDGILGETEQYSQRDLVGAIVQFADEQYDGLIIRSFCRDEDKRNK